MSSLLDTARRLVQLGEGNKLRDIPYWWDHQSHTIRLAEEDRAAIGRVMEAARDADRLAAALLEAEAIIAEMTAVDSARYGATREDWPALNSRSLKNKDRARAFLASLNAKPGDAS